ncbi:MAG: GSCFA domain-containing protein [Bacteroidaceae bacterium]|nr:GSCFA domain-containing protein [Bacteroidaceae bacterium]
MKLQTIIEVPSPVRLIGLHSRVAFLGSCFAQNIGERMRQSGLPALVNPFGVLYNPLSILQVLTQNPTYDPLYFEDEEHHWHCWLTDSSKNASSLEACKAGILSSRGRLFDRHPDVVVITLGTNHYYEHSGIVVGNCHKRPQAEFEERALTMEQMITILDSICQLFAHAQVIFTVSPYRYAKYGFHQSRLSKASLLLAVEAIQRRRPEQVSYFPAYEIQLDELRDYRFYAEDMLHPSPQAIEYIWERFAEHYLDSETHRFLADFEPIRKSLMHRVSDPSSPAAVRFQEQTQQRISELMAKYNLEP